MVYIDGVVRKVHELRLALGYCWVLANRLDVGPSAAVLFFSSMRILDSEQTIISEQQRATALEAMARYLRENPENTFEPLVRRLIEARFVDSTVMAAKPSDAKSRLIFALPKRRLLGPFKHRRISPATRFKETFSVDSSKRRIMLLDLLEAAARESPTAIDRALHAAELSLDGVLDAIRQLSPECLNDRDPSEKTPELPKYAVVIEGRGFHDETNRFPTLIQAQITVEGIEVMRDTDPIPNSVELIGLKSPAQLLEATRIFIKHLS